MEFSQLKIGLRLLDTALTNHKEKLSATPITLANKVGFSLDPWQIKLLESKAKRIVVNCSRQSGKSTTTALLALYKLLYTKNASVIVISPSARQSALFGSKITELRHKLPMTIDLLEDNKMSLWVKSTNSRFYSLPSNPDTVRGVSAVTLAIVDEAAFIEMEILQAILPMLATTDGQLIMLSTPKGKRGYFYEVWENSDNWEKYLVTAYECPRISKEFLESEKKTMPDYWFRQEYLCEFTDTEFSAFSEKDIANAFDNFDEVFSF